jgi:hypothetical protein
MPVTFSAALLEPQVRRIPGRPNYNVKIARLVPAIEEARANGHHSTQAIAQFLNAKGTRAPSGREFTYTTLHRILVRLAELGLCKGPRSVSAAASARPAVPRMSRASRQAEAARARARIEASKASRRFGGATSPARAPAS